MGRVNQIKMSGQVEFEQMSKMIKILDLLGFERVSGPLWKHKKSCVMVQVKSIDDLKNLPERLVKIGEEEFKIHLKTLLGIAPA
jgi:hypothetical protein